MLAVTVLLLLLMSTTAFATNSAEVCSEAVMATTDKAILIPVRIKNNPGIMGFKIAVDYDKAVLASPKVTKGSVTQNGMMNDSIGVTPEGVIDVVWSGTQNETADGTLFVISFESVKAEDTQIKLSYSQPDTFNEAWEDVELKCSDITVNFTSNEVKKPESKTEEKTSSTEIVDTTSQIVSLPRSEEIKNAVDIVLGETDKGHIDEIPEENKSDFVDRTNEVLNQLTGGHNKPFESIDEIKDAYNNSVADEFVEDAKETIDSDKIDEAIKDSLASVGAESIDKVPAEKKEEFMQKVESNIAQYAPDVDTISDKLTADEAVEAIKQLQNENEEAATEGMKVPEPQTKNNTVTVVTVVAAILIAAIVIAVAVVNRKRKKNEEAK